jgi:tetratricopeptide (TPR) repeat protein
MLALPDVTLACVDTRNAALATRALALSRNGIRFARTLFFTDATTAASAPDGIEAVEIGPLASRDDYSRFVLKSLLPHVATSHVLLVQWDGYAVNPQAWEPAFLESDYIGAKWFWFDDGHDVGNGGFSLRSRKLLEALQDPRVELVDAEDVTIGRHCRDWLERDYGIRFADGALADRFAFEAAFPIGRPFGFHGLFNFCRVMPADELAALAPSFSDAIATSPQLAQLLRNCVATGAWAPAIAIAQRMLAVDPANGEVRELLARSEDARTRGLGVGRNDPCPCGSGKRYKQCHGAIGAATAAPAAPPADDLVRRALALHQRGDLASAERDYRAALAIAPDHPHALHFLGVVEYQRGRAEAALPLVLRSVELRGDEPEFHNNLGLVYAALDRNDASAAAHRRAIALKPDHAGAWNNLGLVLHAGNDLASAAGAYQEALRRAPGFTQARWNLALTLLADGRFREGWQAYEARLDIADFRPADRPATPRWNGADPAGKRIVLTTEQGLGDAIQFIRFVPTLSERGARVIVQAPPALAGLFRTMGGVAEVATSLRDLPPHDAWLPLQSLPGMLGVDASMLPGPIPYLASDGERRADVRAALSLHRGRLRAGLAWAGNARNTNDRRRSAPLAALAPLLDLPGIAWFTLQTGDAEAQVADVPAASKLVHLDARNDFDGTAALIDELDVVVSVDTSFVHLAGALGRPVFVMLPFASDWRWRTKRSDSDWYPTARLFRQASPGDWTSVVDAVAAALTDLPRRR